MTGAAYDRAADGWATGASLVYAPLAAELVARSPHALAGRTVLDAGAGTGCVSDALQAAGARPVAADGSLGMLRWRMERRPPAFVGDVTRLPLRDSSVDDSVAAFVLNHVRSPSAGLAELARVTRPGGVVLADVFAASSSHRARDRLDELAVQAGFVPPKWYVEMKTRLAPAIGSVPAMLDAARGAGLRRVLADQAAVDVGVHTAAALVEYRLGQAHYAGWLAGLPEQRQRDLRGELAAAIEPWMEPYRPLVVVLVARVG